MALLEARDVTMSFGRLTAVNRVSLEIEEGEILALIGPNGAGKTSMFNVITGVYRADSGTVRLRDREILGLRPYEIARLGVARTFQNIELVGGMSLLDNVLTGFHLQLGQGMIGAAFRLPATKRHEQQARDESLKLLEYVGLPVSASQQAWTLPFGQQRLLELARALALRPKLLLLDEPASGLSHDEVDALMELLRRVRKEMGITIFVVEHVMELVMNLCDRVVVLDYGETIAQGTPAEVKANRRVIEAYLGEG